MTIYKLFEINELEYSPDRVYKKGDICIFMGKRYTCLSDESVSQNPLYTSDWDHNKTN
jgi:hypothetical protein